MNQIFNFTSAVDEIDTTLTDMAHKHIILQAGLCSCAHCVSLSLVHIHHKIKPSRDINGLKNYVIALNGLLKEEFMHQVIAIANKHINKEPIEPYTTYVINRELIVSNLHYPVGSYFNVYPDSNKVVEFTHVEKAYFYHNEITETTANGIEMKVIAYQYVGGVLHYICQSGYSNKLYIYEKHGLRKLKEVHPVHQQYTSLENKLKNINARIHTKICNPSTCGKINTTEYDFRRDIY